nr:MAG TPA: hypothetical protein [Caudoviricetes sp.]
MSTASLQLTSRPFFPESELRYTFDQCVFCQLNSLPVDKKIPFLLTTKNQFFVKNQLTLQDNHGTI